MLPLFLLAAIVISTTVLTEVAARRGWLPYWVARKILHVVGVGVCAYAVLAVQRELLCLVVAVTELILLFLVSSRRIMADEEGQPAWGVVWFSLPYLLLLLVEPNDTVICAAMTVLAICDPAATVVGKLAGATRTYKLTGDQKSWAGNAAFFATFVAVTIYFYGALAVEALLTKEPEWVVYCLILQLCCAATAMTTTEALGSKGLDNLFVPLVAYALYVEGVRNSVQPALYGPVAIVAAVLFSWWATRRGSLTMGGALTAGVMAYLVTVLIGPVWLLPLLLFFGSSTLIGKVFPSQTTAGDYKHQQPRDATQVLANGGLYVLVIIFHDVLTGWSIPSAPVQTIKAFVLTPHFVPMSLTCIMAIATADTWSSEIGQYFKHPTYDVLRGRKVLPGLSGGVSLVGSLAGAIGSGLIGVSMVAVGVLPASLITITTVVIVGTLGMLIDSALGAALQITYTDRATGFFYDTPETNRIRSGGYAWVTNDTVNVLAIFLGWLVYLGFVVLSYYYPAT